jgi:YesN/AraC family two-component response regulator
VKYFGIDLSNLLRVGLLGKEHLVPPRMHFTRRTSEHIMYIMTEGELYLKVDGECANLRAGDIFIFESGCFQQALKSTDCRYYYIHFYSDAFESFNESEEKYYETIKSEKTQFLKANPFGEKKYNYLKVFLKEHYVITDKGFFDYVINVLENNMISGALNEPARRLEISSTVMNLFFKLESHYFDKLSKNNLSGKIYNTALTIANYINENYANDFTSKDIEQKFFLNFDYANRIFKKITGLSIIKYRNLLRLNVVKTKIQTSNKSLEEICYEVGFSDKHYFSRLFKKSEGISPSEYKKRVLRDTILKGEGNDL